MLLILTPCTAKKDDSTPIPEGSRILQLEYYLSDDLVSELRKRREMIFYDPRAHLGDKTTYAFDLYVNTGRTYGKIMGIRNWVLKLLLSGSEIEWFFISGGYGIIHSLEEARKYQASLNRNIAYQNGIPYTGNNWNSILSVMLDFIIARFNPEWVYVFGSKDYTHYVKQTRSWKTRGKFRMFESTGSSGPNWLAPKLRELIDAILSKHLDRFNSKYPRFLKQDAEERAGATALRRE